MSTIVRRLPADVDAYELYHHGIKGQRWGVRRYQNADGSLTPAGQKRYYNQIDKIGKSTKRGISIEEGQKNIREKTDIGKRISNDENISKLGKDIEEMSKPTQEWYNMSEDDKDKYYAQIADYYCHINNVKEPDVINAHRWSFKWQSGEVNSITAQDVFLISKGIDPIGYREAYDSKKEAYEKSVKNKTSEILQEIGSMKVTSASSYYRPELSEAVSEAFTERYNNKTIFGIMRKDELEDVKKYLKTYKYVDYGEW